MLKAGLTYEDVASAALVLRELGQDVSVSSVHRQLGAGSRFVIGRYLARWRTEHLPHPAEDEVPPTNGAAGTPVSTSALAQALGSLGHALHESTETQLKPLQEKTDLLSGEIAALREEASQSVAGTTNRLKAITSGMRSADKGLSTKLDQITKRLDASELGLSDAQRRIKDAGKKWQEDLDALSAKLDQTSREHTAFMSDLASQVQALTETQANLAKAMRKQDAASQSQVSGLEQRLVSLGDIVSALANRLESPKPKKDKK